MTVTGGAHFASSGAGGGFAGDTVATIARRVSGSFYMKRSKHAF